MTDSATGFLLALALVVALYGVTDPDGAAQIIRQAGRVLYQLLPG